MIDEISIKKNHGNVGKRELRSWGTHLEKKIAKANAEKPTQSSSVNADNDLKSSPPDLDDVFNFNAELVLFVPVVLLIGMILTFLSSVDSIVVDHPITQDESSQTERKIEQNEISVHDVDITESVGDDVKYSSYELSTESIAIISDKLDRLDLEKEIYISRPISELDLSLEHVDALLHCDYLEFSGEALSFRKSYYFNFNCVLDGSEESVVVQKQYYDSRDNLAFSGYVTKGNIVFTHHDNVRFAKMLGYENLIEYETRTDIQKDYVTWLTKSLVTWDVISNQ